MHAEQSADDGAALLGIDMGAVSVDHLDAISEETVAKLAKSGTIAVLLPGASFLANTNLFAPARKLIDAGAIVALATDLNPGSSNIYAPSFVMTLAALKLGMSPEEAIVAFTKNAAFALNLGYTKGCLMPGMDADIAILRTDDYRDLAYMVGADIVDTVIARGTILKQKGVLSEKVGKEKPAWAESVAS